MGEVILVVWLLAAVLLKPYNSKSPSAFDITRALELTAVMAASSFLALELLFGETSRTLHGFFLVFVPVALLLLVAARYAKTRTAEFITEKWPQRVAVLAEGPDAMRIVERIQLARDRQSIAGLILPASSRYGSDGVAIPVLGATNTIAETINREHLSRIIISSHVPEEDVDECCRVAKRMGVIVSRTIHAPVTDDARIEFTTLYGMHLLELRPVAFTRRQQLIKRAFDAVLAFIAILFALPVMIAAAIAIKLSSPGPVLYSARRVGRGGRYFTFLKFRTMRHETMSRVHVTGCNEQNGHLFKIKNDPRVTRVGRILRRYSIDELPQLINVLMGDMSLVGPRPLPIDDLDADGLSKRFAKWAEHRSRVQPGITGLWQVSGRSDIGFDGMMTLDIRYIEEWSLSLDIRIILKTPRAVFSTSGAY
jgi:exopolysaccharide biosynthesis polyprenyl glycosylphosphotransferase